MKQQKLNLATMQGKLSRDEMKNILGGVVEPLECSGSCDVTIDGVVKKGTCKTTSNSLCYCSSGLGQC